MTASTAALAGTSTTRPTALRRTRALTVIATVFLLQNVFGNLYEQNAALANLADPTPGALADELAVGSPLFYYMPWVLIGLVAAVILVVRMHRMRLPAAPRGRIALALLAIGTTAKTLLITSVNPLFRDAGQDPERVRELTMLWLTGNGLTIVVVAAAITLLISWRAKAADVAADLVR
jgi:hypothetical protein